MGEWVSGCYSDLMQEVKRNGMGWVRNEGQISYVVDYILIGTPTEVIAQV